MFEITNYFLLSIKTRVILFIFIALEKIYFIYFYSPTFLHHEIKIFSSFLLIFFFFFFHLNVVYNAETHHLFLCSYMIFDSLTVPFSHHCLSVCGYVLSNAIYSSKLLNSIYIGPTTSIHKLLYYQVNVWAKPSIPTSAGSNTNLVSAPVIDPKHIILRANWRLFLSPCLMLFLRAVLFLWLLSWVAVKELASHPLLWGAVYGSSLSLSLSCIFGW